MTCRSTSPPSLVTPRPAAGGSGTPPSRRLASRSRWTRPPCAPPCAQLRDAGVEAVAVCFLYGFINPTHEESAARILARIPRGLLCVSHAVAPEFREFERMSTAVVNAYLGPVMQRYIRRLAGRLTELGWPRRRI